MFTRRPTTEVPTPVNESTLEIGDDREFDTEISMEMDLLLTQSIVLEGIGPDELEAFTTSREELDTVEGETAVTEKSIVKLDRSAKLSQSAKVAGFQLAKEANDPDFSKLQTVWQLERYLEAKIEKKYGTRAAAIARKKAAQASTSKAPTLRKAAATVSRKLNRTVAKPTVQLPHVAGLRVPNAR